jgi:hypothetical protein
VSPGSTWIGLLALATVVDAVLAGASLDQSIKQLPARQRVGVVAFSTYSRASDLANGVAWYAALGIGGSLLTVTAAGAAWALDLPTAQRLSLAVAGVLAIAHTVATARAAPINFSQRSATDETVLSDIFDRFERWQTLRASLQFATFLCMVWALATNVADSARS